MADSSTSTANSHHLPRARISQDYRLIWVDGSFNESDSDCQNTVQQLRAIVNDVQVFTNSNACVDFLRGVSEEKVLVIISDSLGKDLVPQIHSMSQVNTIYIFCRNREWEQAWTEDWSKIKGVYTRIESICDALEQSLEQRNQESTPTRFVSPDENESKINLNQLEPSFMYTQLFKEALLDMKHDEDERKTLVAYCRKQKKDLPDELEVIDEFERQYRPDKAIWWYTRGSLIYQMLNRALRLLEADIIVNMGFFIHDLHRQIKQLHREQLSQYGGKTFNLYRGQALSSTDFDKLRSTKGGLLSFNSFLSTSKDRNVARFLADSSSRAANKVGILLVMTINPASTSTPFADIDEHSYLGEGEEVLFSMHSVFRVEQVKGLDDLGRLFEVRLTLTSDDDPQLHLLRENMVEELQGSSGWERIGQLLMRVGQLEKAEELYRTLLEQGEDEDNSTHYNQQLGSIKEGQGDYKGALSYYEKCLDIEQRTLSANHPSLAISYSNIGSVCDSMGEYSKALSHYEKSIDICQKSLPPDHPDLVNCCNNIGSVYGSMGEYSKALSYYEKAFSIMQKTLPANHPNLATSCFNIGSVYSDMGEYSKALAYYERCLDVRQKSLPANHPDLASSYNNMGSVYSSIGEYSKALSYYEKALDMMQLTLPANHPSLATTYNNIGSVYSNMGEYQKALSSHERALDIRQQTLPANHPALANSYNNIGLMYSEMGEYSKGLLYYEKCLDMEQRTLPANHPNLATSYSNIGSVYSEMGEYSKALSHYEKSFAIQQKSLPANHPSLAHSFNNIGSVYHSMGEHSKALSYYEKSLDMRQKTLPANHPDLASSYSNIGFVYSEMGEHSKALSYFEKSLDMRQKTLPANHPALADCYNNIGSVYSNMGDYAKALSYFQRALDIWRRALPPNHPNIESILQSIEITKKKL